MKNYHFLKISSLFLLFSILMVSCSENSSTIVFEEERIESSMQLTIESVTSESEAYARHCFYDTYNELVISNVVGDFSHFGTFDNVGDFILNIVEFDDGFVLSACSTRLITDQGEDVNVYGVGEVNVEEVSSEFITGTFEGSFDSELFDRSAEFSGSFVAEFVDLDVYPCPE